MEIGQVIEMIIFDEEVEILKLTEWVEMLIENDRVPQAITYLVLMNEENCFRPDTM
jgi:hypothetical protein